VVAKLPSFCSLPLVHDNQRGKAEQEERDTAAEALPAIISPADCTSGQVSSDCGIEDYSQVCRNSVICGQAIIRDKVRISGDSRVFSHAQVFGKA